MDDNKSPTSPADVGCTIVSGRPPVEPTSAVVVGARIEESRPPTSPADDDGWTIVSGRPPLEPGTMKGPRKLDASAEDGAAEEAGPSVGVTMVSGTPPVEPIRCPDRPVPEVVADGASVGWTAEEGATPVDPNKGARRDESRPPVDSWATEETVSVGKTTTGGIPPVEPTAEEDGWTMVSELSAAVEVGADGCC
jgi:hypothetical protein